MEITARIQGRSGEQIQARRKWRARSYRKRCKVGIGEKSGYSRQGNARKTRPHSENGGRTQSSFSWLVVRAVERAPLGPHN